MEDRKQQEVAPGAMSERLDNLLAKAQAQDPAQIKTVKEFIADKRAAEAAEAAPISSNFADVEADYEVSGEEETSDMSETTSYYVSESMSESEGPTTSRI